MRAVVPIVSSLRWERNRRIGMVILFDFCAPLPAISFL